MYTAGNIINAFLDDEVITNYKYRWDTEGVILVILSLKVGL